MRSMVTAAVLVIAILLVAGFIVWLLDKRDD